MHVCVSLGFPSILSPITQNYSRFLCNTTPLSPFCFLFLQRPGVFNSPFMPAPDEMELLLRQVKYQVPTRLASRGKACLLGIPSSTSSSFPGTLGSPLIKTSRTCSSRPILPPIGKKKQQVMTVKMGPMKDINKWKKKKEQYKSKYRRYADVEEKSGFEHAREVKQTVSLTKYRTNY